MKTLESLMKSNDVPSVLNITSDCRIYYDDEIQSFIVKNGRKVIYCDDGVEGAIKSVEKLFNITVAES